MNCAQIMKEAVTKIIRNCFYFNLWAQQGMILRPPDYESGATNQLSYGPSLFYYFIRTSGFEPVSIPMSSGCS